MRARGKQRRERSHWCWLKWNKQCPRLMTRMKAKQAFWHRPSSNTSLSYPKHTGAFAQSAFPYTCWARLGLERVQTLVSVAETTRSSVQLHNPSPAMKLSIHHATSQQPNTSKTTHELSCCVNNTDVLTCYLYLNTPLWYYHQMQVLCKHFNLFNTRSI